MISSAAVSNVGGMLIPSVFAVVRSNPEMAQQSKNGLLRRWRSSQ
jgi:hypothetical protein